MKKMKWIALLSVLLGASVAFAACGDNGDKTGGKPQAAPTVEAKFSNFIKVEPKKDYQNISSQKTLLNETYGKLVDDQNGIYVFVKTDRTPLDEISVVYTVYNVKTKSVAFTKEFKYQNGDYEGTDMYGNEKLPPLYVDVELDGDAACPYICVETITNEKRSEEEIQAQIDRLKQLGAPDDYIYQSGTIKSYKQSSVYEYYSIDGKLICKSNYEIGEPDRLYDSEYRTYIFGNVAARFDEDGALIEKWNVETEDHVTYAYETEKYGYSESLYGCGYATEIYNKADGSLVYRYTLDFNDMMYGSTDGVLSDGDLYMQKTKPTEGVSYDFIDDGQKFDLITERIDVETGDVVEIDFPYLIEKSYTKDEWSELFGDELVMTENVYNVAIASKIVGGEVSDEEVILFFDDMLNVQYELGSLIPGHKILKNDDELNLEVLPSGDFLIDLDTPLTVNGHQVDRAVIRSDGTILSYVPVAATVMDEYIVLENERIEIYNVDGTMAGLFDYPENMYSDYTWSQGGRFGNGYIWNGERLNATTGESEYITYRIYEVENWYEDSSIEYGYDFDYSVSYDRGELIDFTQDWSIFLYNGEYRVYDGNMNYIFVSTAEPIVECYDDYVEIQVDSYGERLVYILPYATEITENTEGGAEKW